ncbi:MAG: hypothetical protein K0R82_1231 [Flavipsychrobacter sp.]|jgi:hypothetical protein|nr:hypothetical protein [Flavipsychrobacter sp.]
MRQKRFWLKLTGMALLLHVALIICSILEVAIYSYLIVPGQDNAHYQRHAETSGPWISGLVGSLFVFLLVRRYIRSNSDRRLTYAIALPVVYMIMDIAMLLPFQINWREHLPVFLMANGAKLAASLLSYYMYKGSPAKDQPAPIQEPRL